MVQITLTSDSTRNLRPIVESALANELRLLQAGIRRTGQRLGEFEARYQMQTSEFVRRYENDELEETLDFAEWIGERRLMDRQQEKLEALRGIRIAD